MFRPLTTIALLFLFAAQTFQREGFILGYFLNTEPYAKNCVNKARPQLRCNGKCQLAQKIREKEQQEQNRPDRKGETQLIVCLPFPAEHLQFHLRSAADTASYAIPADEGHPTDRAVAIFHPPCA